MITASRPSSWLARALALCGLLLLGGVTAWIARPVPPPVPAAVPPPAATALPPPAAETVILCGSSMRVPIEAVVALARSKGLAVRVDYGGSETLLPRLLAGERADLAVLHDPFPEKLAAAGLLVARLDVGGLEPMLVTAPGNPLGLSGLADLARAGLRVGLPDARYSTCGEYLQARLRADRLAEGVAPRVVVEQRQHVELVTAVRVGSIDAAVVWNFVALPARPTVAAMPLPGPWPATTVAVCTLRGGEAASGRLTAAVGGEAEIARIFAANGFAAAAPNGR